MITGLTYDDILLIPSKSLDSRNDPNLETQLTRNIKMDIPIVSANMDTVTGPNLAVAMSKFGGTGFLHRNNLVDECVDNFEQTQRRITGSLTPAIPTVGVNEIFRIDRILHCTPKAICIDIANAYSDKVKQMIEHIQNIDPDVEIIVGNVASAPGALFLADLGVSAIKVGIGPGSVCTTRSTTGFGIPQFTAVQMVKVGLVYRGFLDVPVIADGGLKNSGDIVKAIFAGANVVMSGRFFAGCVESEQSNHYRGMASSEARKILHNDEYVDTIAEEGVVTDLEWTGSVMQVLEKLCNGIRSGMSYGGCRTIDELIRSEHITPIRQTQNGMIESGTRI